MVAWDRLAVVLGVVLVFAAAPGSAASGGDADHCDEVTMGSVLVEGYHVRSGMSVGEGSVGTEEGPLGVWEESNALEGLQVEDCYVWEDEDEEETVLLSGDVRVAGSQDANDGWDGAQGTVNETWGDAVDTVNETWEDAVDTVNETYDDAWEDASEAYEEAGEQAGEAYDEAWREASEAYEEAGEEAGEAYESVWKAAAGLVDDVVGIINEVW